MSGGKVLSGYTDDRPKLAAIDRLLKIAERRARLLGLDLQPGTLLPAAMEIILKWHDDDQHIIWGRHTRRRRSGGF